jgi:hypothetical protein
MGIWLFYNVKQEKPINDIIVEIVRAISELWLIIFAKKMTVSVFFSDY